MDVTHQILNEAEATEPSSAGIDRIACSLLVAAGAVQRLVAERNALRNRVAAQELELARFRRHSSLIHDSYRKLTTEFVSQFQLIDNAACNFVQGEPLAPADVSLAEPTVSNAYLSSQKASLAS
jgi:hypothetical protein